MSDIIELEQNKEYSYRHRKEAVEENYFLAKPVDLRPLPQYADVKENLPSPIWEGHEDYLQSYWKAWEMAFNNLFQPIEGTGFVSPFIDTAFNGCTFMWDSCFMLMFEKYADKLFHFQGTLDISILFSIETDLYAGRLLSGQEKITYPFGKDGEMTLICEARNSVTDRPVITVKSNRPIEIVVYYGDDDNRKSLLFD